MNIEEQKIRNIIGQLETSIDKAENLMDDEVFEEYCADIHSCIAKWRVAIRTAKKSGE